MKTAKRVVLLCLLGVLGFGSGCQGPTIDEVRQQKAWSAETAWHKVDNDKRGVIGDTVRIFNKDAGNAVDRSFIQELDLAASSQLPVGGVAGLLDSIRSNVAEAIKEQERYLVGGGSGLILLGELTGPDGTPLGNTSRGAKEITAFMGDLLAAENLKDRWYYLSMTPTQADQYFGNAGAGGGNAIQDGGSEYVYNKENVLVLNLNITAQRNEVERRVDYEGVGSIAAPSTRTSSGISGAEIQYYFQPYMGEWITGEEEAKRQLIDDGVRAEEAAAKAAEKEAKKRK